jgi:hypothetical protein
VGEWDLGVRCTSSDVLALLRQALASHVVEPDEPPAPSNFSLTVAADGRPRAVKDFHLLYRGAASVVRTRDLRRLFEALFAYLSGVAEVADAGSVRLDVMAFVKDGAAILVPAAIRSSLPLLERRLNAKGLFVLDRPWVRVDVATGEMLVSEPDLVVDRSVVAGIGRTDGGGRGGYDCGVPAGRYPIVGWGFGVGAAHEGPVSRALAVTLAGEHLLDRAGTTPQVALDRLCRLVRGIPPVALWADRPEELVGPLAALRG